MGKWAQSGLTALGETLCCACTVLKHFQTVSYSISPETLCLRVLRTETLEEGPRSGQVRSALHSYTVGVRTFGFWQSESVLTQVRACQSCSLSSSSVLGILDQVLCITRLWPTDFLPCWTIP